MTLISVAYVEIHASSGTAGWWISGLEACGFCRADFRAKANPGRDTCVLRRGHACIVLPEVHPGSDADRHVRRHGDGVADVVLIVDDAAEAWARAVAAGASSGLTFCPAATRPGGVMTAGRVTISTGAAETGPQGITHLVITVPDFVRDRQIAV